MHGLIIGVSGVRGVVGEGLTPDVVYRFAAAFGNWCGKGKVLVGRDSRTSGPILSYATIAGLLSVDTDVIDLGLCPTPTLQLAVEQEDAGGGIVITASHNPISYNGLKFVGSDGTFLDGDQLQQLLDLFQARRIDKSLWEVLGREPEKMEAIEDHISKILALDILDVELIRGRRFKVALDACNGVGGLLGVPLLERLGCQVIKLNCEPTGIFSRPPEPVPENLPRLCFAVRKEGVDVGFGLDPDGDRLSIVSDKGQAVGEEYSQALAAKLVLSKRKGQVVTNLSSSQMLDDIASGYGVKVIRTPVGEINVVRMMKKLRAVIGGEGNGGIILPELHLARDAAVGMSLILQLMAESEHTISELIESIPHYTIVKRKFQCEDMMKQRALKFIQQIYSHEEMDTSDGVKITRGHSWLHIRKSNTEPIIRVIAEARTEGEASSLCAEVINKLEEYIRSHQGSKGLTCDM
ncbi:MAG TPA: phosphoglucosamine mutase [Candidatus Latescibacteria bacterium]|nr:phosphoglucosamine mutase [Candidatus Latescibacterota bacterium]